MFKHDVLENLGLQIQGFSREQIASMLVSIGAQHSHLPEVLLPFFISQVLFAPGFVIPFTPFLAHHCCWLNHSENSCHKQLEPLPNMFFSSSLSCIGQIICTSGVFEHPCHHNELLQQTDCFLVLLFLSLICRKKMIYKCSRMSSYKNAMQCTHTNSKVFKASALRYR